MRVVLVNSHGADPAYGGAERYVRDLAHGLRERGHEAVVLSAFPPRADAGVETIVLHEADWRDSPARRIRNHLGDLASAPSRRIGALLAQIRPDLVHTSNLPGFGSGVWELARRAAIPVVHTLHDYHLLCPRTTLIRPDGRPCEPSPLLCGLRSRRLGRWAGAVSQLVAGSEHLLRVHRGRFPAAEQRVIRLPLSPPPAGRGAPSPGLSVLGYLGALSEVKGVRLLLEAAEPLAAAGIELRLAGDGPLRPAVEASGVRYLGRVEGAAKWEFLASCDAGVVPSLWNEPSGPPYVVNEWLAAARPVLTTRRGGLAEAIGGAVRGFGGSAEELVAAATELRDERAWRETVAALPTVAGAQDERRWLDEHLEVYARALAKAGREAKR
jgi:glycosyltransferase involved in cell wall biosynthesis